MRRQKLEYLHQNPVRSGYVWSANEYKIVVQLIIQQNRGWWDHSGTHPTTPLSKFTGPSQDFCKGVKGWWTLSR